MNPAKDGSRPDAEAACRFRCSASKRTPFFQTSKVMAAILRVRVNLLLGRAIEAELSRGTKPYDPLTLAGTTLLLVATGALACWIPARTAARVDQWWPYVTNSQALRLKSPQKS
jgi:hypothetical protein